MTRGSRPNSDDSAWSASGVSLANSGYGNRGDPMADLCDGRRVELGFRSSCEVDVRGDCKDLPVRGEESSLRAAACALGKVGAQPHPREDTLVRLAPRGSRGSSSQA